MGVRIEHPTIKVPLGMYMITRDYFEPEMITIYGDIGPSSTQYHHRRTGMIQFYYRLGWFFIGLVAIISWGVLAYGG